MGASSTTRTSLETIRSFFSYFLEDRISSEPFSSPSSDLLEWGTCPILKQVIQTPKDLDSFLLHPLLCKNTVAILEPWQNVGINPDQEPVRASKNVAYILKKIGNVNSMLFPLWDHIRSFEQGKISSCLSNCLLYVIEGGAPSVYDESSFSSKCSKQELIDLIQELLLNRTQGPPGLFICLGHQLVCETHVHLIRRAVREILQLSALEGDKTGEVLASLQMLAKKMIEVGEKIRVILPDGSCLAQNWNSAHFCTTKNVKPELRGHRLSYYEIPSAKFLNVPSEVIETYEMNTQYPGLIDLMEKYSESISVDMFHGDIATDQAIIFSNWAYMRLYSKVNAYRHIIANSPISWLLSLPYAVKILASTRIHGKLITANAATCIFYKDFDTGRMLRSFSTQFHPELMDDLKDFSHRKAPAYLQMKKSSSMRMLIHLMQTLLT